MPLPVPNSPWPPAPFDTVAAAVTESQAWWEGSPSRLADLYDGATQGTSTSLSGFAGFRDRMGWGANKDTRSDTARRVHVPIAADLAATSRTLLLSDPASFSIPQDAGNDKAKTRVDLILNSSDTHSTMLEAAETCAALGGTFPRLVWNKDVADHVWLDFVDADQAIPEFKYGRLSGVLFARVLDHNDGPNVVLRHFEHHMKGGIRHALYKGTPINVGRVESLAAHPETKDIPVNADGVIITNVPGLTAGYIPNVRPNPAWRSLGVLRNLGRSDFGDAGVVSLMDLADDAYSSLAREIRLARARLLVSETLVDTGKPGQGSDFDVDKEAFMIVAGSPAQAPTLELHQALIRVDEHLAAVDAYTREILRRVGYSPGTFGMSDDVAMTATEVDAQVRRSVETHKAKSGYWIAGLSGLSATAIQLDAQIFRTGATVSEVEIDWAPPVRESQLARAQTVQVLDQARAISLETKVATLWPTKDETWRQEEVNRLRAEQAVADPLAFGADVFDGAADPAADPAAVTAETPPEAEDADILKAKFDALGVAVRAGVDPNDAASRLGMAGIRLTGLVPTNLKDPDAPAKPGFAA